MRKTEASTPSRNEIVVFQPKKTMRLEVNVSHDTVWLTQSRIAELFGVQKAAISKHLKNIFASGELNRRATVSKMETVRFEGGRQIARSLELFNLDVIIAVGYRVNSIMATRFRIWATTVLREYMLRGFALNSASVKDAGRRMFALVRTALDPDIVLSPLPDSKPR